MTSTNDLMNDARISWTPLLDGSTEVRFASSDLVWRYWPYPKGGDPWRYKLPTGEIYSHPFEDGCRIQIIGDMLERRLFVTPEDNSHLDEKNTEIAKQTAAAYAALSPDRPRLGDFVIRPDGTTERFSYLWPDGPQTSESGSFYIDRDGHASFSGGLNGPRPWDRFHDTGATRRGRFWFFSHNRAGAGRGVDFYLTCRIYQETD